MKKALKLINAALFLAAFGVSYVELVRVAVVNANLIDLIMIGLKKASVPVFAREIINIVQEEAKPLAILALSLVALMWLGVIFSLVLRRNLPYVCGLILAVIQAAGLIGIYFTINSRLGIIRDGLDFFGMGSRVKMYSYTLVIWLVIYALIILLSIIGLVLKEKQKEEDPGLIMTEQFNPRRNPLENQREGKCMNVEQGYLVKIRELEQKGRAEHARQTAAERTFSGAIIGMTGTYASMAYPLQEKQRVFFLTADGRVSLSDTGAEAMVAALYYINEYQEYCMEIYETKNVFLKSGQPLGKDRKYYLPRGTEVYLLAKENCFKLA